MKIDIEELERLYNINTEDMYETSVCQLFDELRNMLPDIIAELKDSRKLVEAVKRFNNFINNGTYGEYHFKDMAEALANLDQRGIE